MPASVIRLENLKCSSSPGVAINRKSVFFPGLSVGCTAKSRQISEPIGCVGKIELS